MKPRSRYLLGCRALARVLTLGVLLSGAGHGLTAQQPISNFDRDRWSTALGVVKNDIIKNYYDPKFRGIDIEAHFKRAQEKMSQAQSLSQLFGIIAQTLVDFDDSHLYFLPPSRSALFEYGWRVAMVGDRAFVTAVKQGSDAEAKGLKAGDQVISIDGNEVDRQNLWKMQYLYFVLRPVDRVRFMVASPGSPARPLDVMTKITPRKRVLDLTASDADINEFIGRLEESEVDRTEASRTASFGDNQVLLWRFEQFAHTRAEIDRVMSTARRHKALIVDLRGNGGGSEETLLRLIGNLFDRDVTVGQIKGRKETKPLVAKSRGAGNVYGGDLAVLVDSESGSASELFARVVQLEKRGTVLGDRSSGAVMRSRLYTHGSGVEVIATYGVSVTDADIVMTDGQSLEKIGVTPDTVVLPAAADLAARRDPVLSAAFGKLGFTLDPAKAGAVFPAKW